jgi:hypothetical protein
MQKKGKGNICPFDRLNVDEKGDVEMTIVTKELKREIYSLLGICNTYITAICCRDRFLYYPTKRKAMHNQLMNDASNIGLTLIQKKCGVGISFDFGDSDGNQCGHTTKKLLHFRSSSLIIFVTQVDISKYFRQRLNNLSRGQVPQTEFHRPQ